MKIKLILLFLLLFFLFSSCASLGIRGNDKTGVPDEDTTGTGLDINFNIDETNKKHGELKFSVNLKNTGKEPITLTRDNFILSTTIKNQEGKDVLTSESIDNFYKTVLGEDESITLIQNEERGIGRDEKLEGSLFIEESFFEKNYNKEIEFLLHTNYDYETTFDNTLQIDLRSDRLLKVIDGGVSQAAPVQITEIEMDRISVDEYIIKYTIRDKGNYGDSSITRNIDIKNIDFKFRGNSLNDCKAKSSDNYFEYNSGDKIQLNKENREIDLECLVNLDEVDKDTPTNVKTSGSFSYNYVINQKEIINLPDERIIGSTWGNQQ